MPASSDLLLAAATPAGEMVASSGLPLHEIGALVGTGLGAGILGGLLGIGGSVIMIPVLTLVFRHDQHLSQAAAMIVNVVVAVASFTQHQRRGAIPWPIVQRMIPAAIVAIVIGVGASNLFEGTALKRVFGVFLIFVIAVNVQRLLSVRRARRLAANSARPAGKLEHPDDAGTGSLTSTGWARPLIVSGIIGLAAGLLGIGGGIIAVPLCQRILRLPLRVCIATSATLMCLTAPVGAVVKNATLGSLALAQESLVIAGVLAPTAIIGSLVGARLTHVLPLSWIRAVLVFLLSWAAMKFLGVA